MRGGDKKQYDQRPIWKTNSKLLPFVPTVEDTQEPKKMSWQKESGRIQQQALTPGPNVRPLLGRQRKVNKRRGAVGKSRPQDAPERLICQLARQQVNKKPTASSSARQQELKMHLQNSVF